MTGTRTVEGPGGTPVIEVRGLSKAYGEGPARVVALDEIDLDVRRGEFVSVVGPSGCGKTTLLMCIAGLRETSGGSVWLSGGEVTEPAPGLAVVFQDYSRSLFPWFTCARNVGLALWDSGLGKREVRDRVHDVLEAVGLAGVEDRYPWQLSGGMQQRVALARALVTSPDVLLMDEPFASVDAQTRATLEDVLLDVWERTGVTVIFVTHDIDESVYLSDRVAVLSHRPSRVRAEVEVKLERPRHQVHTRAHERFVQLRSQVFEMVMGLEKSPTRPLDRPPGPPGATRGGRP